MDVADGGDCAATVLGVDCGPWTVDCGLIGLM